MNKLLFSILFSLIPVIFWFFQYFISKRRGLFDRFKQHFMCYYVDWFLYLLISFFIYTVNINKSVYYILIISLVLNTILHIFWGKIVKKSNSHLFSYENKRVNLLDIFHLFFRP